MRRANESDIVRTPGYLANPRKHQSVGLSGAAHTSLHVLGPLSDLYMPREDRASRLLRWRWQLGPLARPHSAHASLEEEAVAAVHACTRGSAIHDDVLRYQSARFGQYAAFRWRRGTPSSLCARADERPRSLDGHGGSALVRCAAHFPACIVSASRTAFIERRCAMQRCTRRQRCPSASARWPLRGACWGD